MATGGRGVPILEWLATCGWMVKTVITLSPLGEAASSGWMTPTNHCSMSTFEDNDP